MMGPARRGREKWGCAQGIRSALPAVMLLAGVGCGSASQAVYRGYSGPELPDTSLATVELGTVNWARIDEVRIDRAQFGFVKLLPGHHQIEWSKSFGVSVMVDARGIVERRAQSGLTLAAGHTFRLQADRTIGPGYRIYMWIEDLTAGTVLVGDKKP